MEKTIINVQNKINNETKKIDLFPEPDTRELKRREGSCLLAVLTGIFSFLVLQIYTWLFQLIFIFDEGKKKKRLF